MMDGSSSGNCSENGLAPDRRETPPVRWASKMADTSSAPIARPDSKQASSPPETKKKKKKKKKQKKKTKKEKKKTKDNKEGGEDDEDGGNCGRDASAVHVFASLHRNTGTVSRQKVIVCQNLISGRGSTHSSPLSGSAKTVIICIYIQLYVRNYKLDYNECDL
ncbi:Hypothetical predicted protein [Scomber scombrus]|uniref:Uncharacterized protein n=1 Tax=Scomber scombrus TaxID=13677 RepID=A0AAV1PXD2_SCOSC